MPGSAVPDSAAAPARAVSACGIWLSRRPRERARDAVRVHDRDEPVRLGEAIVLGPAADQAAEVHGQDRAARLAFDQLLAMEQIQEARHVARIGAGDRRQLANAERGPVPVGQRPHDPAGLGRVQRPRRPRDRPGAALVAARRDEDGRPVEHQPHVPDEVDVADPLLGQALARARAQERRDDDVGVRGHAPQRPRHLGDQPGIQLPAGPDRQRGAGAGRGLDGQPGVGDVVGLQRDVRRPVARKNPLNLLDGVAENDVVTGGVVVHVGQQRHSRQRRRQKNREPV